MTSAASRFARFALVAAAVFALIAADAPWSIEVRSVRGASSVSAPLTPGVAASLGSVEMKLEQRGVTKTYRGTPLAAIVGLVDDADRTTFNRDLWKNGYAVTLTANDGYAATFDTAGAAPEDVMLALSADGETIVPMVVGAIAKNLWVNDLAVIEIELAAAAGDAATGGAAAGGAAALDDVPPLVVEAGGKTMRFTREELAESPHYVEAIGSYTTSAGTKYTNTYGGVRLARFLGQFAPVSPDATVVFVASDGYETSCPGSQILDASDGDWILAFRMDGQELSSDLGYYRTIKVGPTKPNIDGRLSVRMVAKIVLKLP